MAALPIDVSRGEHLALSRLFANMCSCCACDQRANPTGLRSTSTCSPFDNSTRNQGEDKLTPLPKTLTTRRRSSKQLDHHLYDSFLDQTCKESYHLFYGHFLDALQRHKLKHLHEFLLDLGPITCSSTCSCALKMKAEALHRFLHEERYTRIHILLRNSSWTCF